MLHSTSLVVRTKCNAIYRNRSLPRAPIHGADLAAGILRLVPSPDLSRLAGILSFFTGEGVHSDMDEEVRDRALRTVEAVASDELTSVMVGPDQSFRIESRGVDGFVESWVDFLQGFDTFRLEVTETILRDPHLVTMVTLYATPLGGSAEVETRGGAVWSFDAEGRLTRAEFHLDPDHARRLAGIEPPLL